MTMTNETIQTKLNRVYRYINQIQSINVIYVKYTQCIRKLQNSVYTSFSSNPKIAYKIEIFETYQPIQKLIDNVRLRCHDTKSSIYVWILVNSSSSNIQNIELYFNAFGQLRNSSGQLRLRLNRCSKQFQTHNNLCVKKVSLLNRKEMQNSNGFNMNNECE